MINEWVTWIIAVAQRSEARLTDDLRLTRKGARPANLGEHEQAHVSFEQAWKAIHEELFEARKIGEIGGPATQARIADRAVERIVNRR